MADPGDGNKIISLTARRWVAQLPTQNEIAQELDRRCGENFCWIDRAKEWRFWDGRLWLVDENRRIANRAGELLHEIGETRKKRSDLQTLEKTATNRSIVDRMRDLRAVSATIFDKHDSLNAPGCELFFKDGRVVRGPNERLHYHTKSTAVAPEWGMETPRFKSFLKLVTKDDVNMQAFLQRFAGYCCTRSIREQAVFFCYGAGGNGKSTFINTIASILGGFAITAQQNTFFVTRNEHHAQELAVLEDARMIRIGEPKKGQVWDENRIKQITGGEAIRANLMHQNSTEYQPVGKLVINGNKKPRLRVDEALKRRFYLIPFPHKISDEERIMDFDKTLITEWPGILAWMIDGWEIWEHEGLMPPEKVIEATKEYLRDEDTIMHFVEEDCVEMPTAREPTGTLYAAYKKRCLDSGMDKEDVGTHNEFVETMKSMPKLHERKIFYDKNPFRCFKGLMLKPPVSQRSNND